MSGEDAGSLAYFEWSSPPIDINDPVALRGALRMANPAWGTRLNEDYVLGVERASMDDEEFARERLGIFPDDDDAPKWEIWSEEQWGECATGETGKRAERPGWLVGPVTLAIETRPDRSFSSIVAVGDCREGGHGIELVAHGPGVDWVVDRAVELTSDPDAPVRRVVADPGGPTKSLIPRLEAAGVTVRSMSYNDVKVATDDLFDRVTEAQVVHRNRPALTASVAGATFRTVGDNRLIDRRTDVDVTPINAAGFALWGHQQPDDERPSVYEERGLVQL